MTASRPIREFRLTHTQTGKKDVFVPIEPGKVKFYTCGPTVYGHIHIGNLRGGLVADLLVRYLRRIGYAVEYVRNYTDVDDKIIKRGLEEKKPAAEVAKFYTQEVERDYAMAGMLDPDQKPSVTTHIPEIIRLTEKIISHGNAYVVDGEVLFSVESFKTYGELSRKPLEDLIAGIRVEKSSKKRNPLDFTLWKPAKPDEPSWDSPWGKGRPGWHIECSAMCSKILGDSIDIHHGGEDLIFPHHENEIAQTEAASGKKPFVKYWMHHAFLTFSKQKMSKSVGNVVTARDALSKFGGEVTRYLLLSSYYRSPIDFDDTVLDNSLAALERFYEAKKLALELKRAKKIQPEMRAENIWGEFVAKTESAKRAIDACYANDLNTAGALAEAFTLIREFNRILSEPFAKSTPSSVLGAEALIQVMEDDIGSVIGVGRLDPDKALSQFQAIRKDRQAATHAAGGDAQTGAPDAVEIETLIAERLEARKSKNFARSDEIRNELQARGVEIKDGPQGTTWKYR